MKKEKKPLISVIVPVYNGEKYIKECVDSLINQSYENVEIVIVNDGSTDSTKEIICSNYKKYRNIVIVEKKNSGVSDSRNIGIKLAKGKFITFVDSDDTVEPEFVNYLYNLAMENDSQVALTRFPNKITNKYEKVLVSENKDTIKNVSGDQAARDMLYYKIVISSWNKLYDLNFIKENHILFDSHLFYGEGFDFVINCFLHAEKVSIGSLKYYNYRVDNASSVMTCFRPQLVYGSLDAQKEIRKKILELNKLELIQAQKFAYWHTCCDCLNTMIGCDVVRDNIELYEELKEKCHTNSRFAFNPDVPIKDKFKAIMFWVNPPTASRVINRFRTRKFSKERE